MRPSRANLNVVRAIGFFPLKSTIGNALERDIAISVVIAIKLSADRIKSLTWRSLEGKKLAKGMTQRNALNLSLKVTA